MRPLLYPSIQLEECPLKEEPDPINALGIEASPLRWFWIVFLASTMSVTAQVGEDTTGTQDGSPEHPYIYHVLAGKLAGHEIILETKREMFKDGRRNNDYWYIQDEYLLTKVGRDGKVSDTGDSTLLYWKSRTTEWGDQPEDISEERWDEISGKRAPNLIAIAKGNELKIFNDSTTKSHLIAHFVVSNEDLKLSPGFRKKILLGMYRKDTTSKYEPLLEILIGGWTDTKILSALGVYRVNNSIARGKYDESLAMLDSLIRDEYVDSAIRIHCIALNHSLQALKTALQPAHLVHAIKFDSVQLPPTYPPQDSPTVFWKDERLCLVHEEDKPGQRMRCYDPKNESWEGWEKVRYPETGLSGLFEKWTTPEGTPDEESEAGPYIYKDVCWHDKFGANDQEPSEGLDCQPLILLANPVPDSVRNADYWYPSVDWRPQLLQYFSGSVSNESDLRRAGGSCSAQFGKLEFGERGQLYYSRYHADPWNASVKWNIFPADIIYGRHEYPAVTRPEYRDRKMNFPVNRPYPVVVSPNQKWIAFATDSESINGYALWVAKLEYKK